MNQLLRLWFLILVCSGCFLSCGAITNAQQANSKTSESDTFIQSGALLLQQGKLDQALADFNKANELNPNDFRSYALSGLAYMGLMKMKSASQAFARAIQLNHQDKRLYLLKATADVRRSATDEAIATSRQALLLDPGYAEAHYLIGEALRWDQKRSAEAIAALEKAIKLKPELVESYELLGQILKEAKQEKQAEQVFRQGIAADPHHMSGRFTLGRLLVKQQRLAEARELWNGRTSDEDNTMPKFIDLLTRAEKLKLASEAVAARPNDPDAIVDMGLAVMEGESWVFDGRQKRAIEYFRKALTLKPNYVRAQYAIVKAYIQIADVFKDENKDVDRELALLRRLDSKLAAELEEYRKTYRGAIIGGPPLKLDQ